MLCSWLTQQQVRRALLVAPPTLQMPFAQSGVGRCPPPDLCPADMVGMSGEEEIASEAELSVLDSSLQDLFPYTCGALSTAQ